MRTATKGMPTPWGMSQWTKRLMPDVYLVSTARHGGILVGRKRARSLLSERAIKIGMSWGRFLAYEEDCDCAAVMYEHPELFDDTDAQKLKTTAEDTLRRWYPEYFNAA
jgi:hypothetical protein